MSEKRGQNSHWKRLFAVSSQTRWILVEAAAVLLIWESAGRILEFRPSILPTPTRILLEIWREFPILRTNGQTTLEEIVLGLLLAVLLAAPAAYVISVFPRAQQFAEPLLRAIRRAPLLALSPVLLLWFAFGLLPKILVVLLVAFFPAVEGLLMGLRSIPKEMVELLRVMQAGNLQMLFKLSIPGSLPGFFDGLKTAARLGVSGAMVAEFVAADAGLGYLMLSGISKMDVPLVFAVLTVLTAIGLVLCVLVTLLERMLIPWHIEIADQTVVCCGRYA